MKRHKVGQATHSVEVTGSALTVELTNSTIGAIVESRTVRELPFNGKSSSRLSQNGRCLLLFASEALHGTQRNETP
jgi:hypothetical protein